MRFWPKYSSPLRPLIALLSCACLVALCVVCLSYSDREPQTEGRVPSLSPPQSPSPSRRWGQPGDSHQQRASQQPRRVILRGPSIPAGTPDGGPVGVTERAGNDRKPTGAYPLLAFAYQYKSDIHWTVTENPPVTGYARRGVRLWVKKRVYGPGCKGGKWYLIRGGGYVCSARGFVVSDDPDDQGLRYRLPDRSRALQHRYGKVKTSGEPRLFRIPTKEEERLLGLAIRDKREWPEVVDRAMDGIFLVAIDRMEGEAKRRYYRTVRGRYVRKGEVKLFPRFPVRGEPLGRARGLPLAFVFGKDRPLYCSRSGTIKKCGVANKHARFRVVRTLEHEGRRLVGGPDGVLVEREGLRVARRVDRPDEIPAKEKWIHVDLTQQVLVAYEGERPVFATLVSSGKKGYEPPTGVFRILHKHVSITMSGSDPSDGWYEVEEVPWSMYYWEGFALHGAYWHDKFGEVKSHGCTNLAPADAKLLFEWTDPKVPEDWHGVIKKGTRVYFTNSPPPGRDARR